MCGNGRRDGEICCLIGDPDRAADHPSINSPDPQTDPLPMVASDVNVASHSRTVAPIPRALDRKLGWLVSRDKNLESRQQLAVGLLIKLCDTPIDKSGPVLDYREAETAATRVNRKHAPTTRYFRL